MHIGFGAAEPAVLGLAQIVVYADPSVASCVLAWRWAGIVPRYFAGCWSEPLEAGLRGACRCDRAVNVALPPTARRVDGATFVLRRSRCSP